MVALNASLCVWLCEYRLFIYTVGVDPLILQAVTGQNITQCVFASV